MLKLTICEQSASCKNVSNKMEKHFYFGKLLQNALKQKN